MSKILIAYFSASGETARLARTIYEVTKGDLYEIEPVQHYTENDLNWNNAKSRSSIEMNDRNFRPEIAAEVENMAQYDTVFVGFPIWWYEAPRIIQTFLESYDFSGKSIILFATSGGSGMGKTDEILKKSCHEGNFIKGKVLKSYASSKEVAEWIKSLGL